MLQLISDVASMKSGYFCGPLSQASPNEMIKQSQQNSSLGKFSGSVISEKINESSSYQSSSEQSSSGNGRHIRPSSKPSLLKSNTNLPALLESIKQEE